MVVSHSTASKVCIKDINDGKFIKAESKLEPNRLITPLNESVSRVRVIATVVSRFLSEDQRYATLTLDDGTDTITVRAFREEVEHMGDVKPGDIVDVVGKIKEYNDERYVSIESVHRVDDPNWELVRKLELVLKDLTHHKMKAPEEKTDKVAQDEKLPEQAEAKVEIEEEVVAEDPKMLLLNIIEELDDGAGVKYLTLQSESGLGDEELDKLLSELMNDGEIYEPKIGRFKRV